MPGRAARHRCRWLRRRRTSARCARGESQQTDDNGDTASVHPDSLQPAADRSAPISVPPAIVGYPPRVGSDGRVFSRRGRSGRGQISHRPRECWRTPPPRGGRGGTRPVAEHATTGGKSTCAERLHPGPWDRGLVHNRGSCGVSRGGGRFSGVAADGEHPAVDGRGHASRAETRRSGRPLPCSAGGDRTAAPSKARSCKLRRIRCFSPRCRARRLCRWPSFW